MISNLAKTEDEEIEATVRVPWKSLGLSGRLDLMDMLPCKSAATLQGGKIQATLPAGQGRLVFAAPPDSPLWARMRKARRWIHALPRMAHAHFDGWMQAGPFGAEDAAPYRHPETKAVEAPPDFRGLETAYPPATLPFDPDAVFRTVLGQTGWRKATAKNGDLNMRAELGRPQIWDVVYAYSRIHFPTLVPSWPDNPVELRLRTHNAFAVRVNGEEVYRYGGAGVPRYGQIAAHLKEHVIPIILHPGWNPILLKLVALPGMRISYAFAAPGGDPLPPLGLRATDDDRNTTRVLPEK